VTTRKHYVPGALPRRAPQFSTFIHANIVAQYYAQQQPCDLMVAGPMFGPGELVIGLQKNSTSKKPLSDALLIYTDQGQLAALRNKWTNDLNMCTTTATSSSLGIQALSGVFLMLGAGAAIALVWTCVEVMYFLTKQPQAMMTRGAPSSTSQDTPPLTVVIASAEGGSDTGADHPSGRPDAPTFSRSNHWLGWARGHANSAYRHAPEQELIPRNIC
jgi:hypothetical protein